MISAVKRSTGFGQVRQVRSSRAKTKHGQDAGRSHSGAMGPTEDAAGRRFAAVRTASGSTDRTQSIRQGPQERQGASMTALAGVSPQSLSVAVGAPDSRPRAPMASAGRSIPGRAASRPSKHHRLIPLRREGGEAFVEAGGTSPVVFSPPRVPGRGRASARFPVSIGALARERRTPAWWRERRRCDRPYARTQGGGNSSAERPRTRPRGGATRARFPVVISARGAKPTHSWRGREIAGDDGRVLAGAEEARPAFATEDAAARSKAERPSDISGHHQRHEAERASSRNLVLLPQRAQPTHLPGAKPKHWRVPGAASGVWGRGERAPKARCTTSTRCWRHSVAGGRARNRRREQRGLVPPLSGPTPGDRHASY